MDTFFLQFSWFAQGENAGTYVHFVFIFKHPCKIFIYFPFFKNLKF